MTHKIIFENIEWLTPGPGMRYKAFTNGNQRLRMVEFSHGFVEPDWCEAGHAGLVLDGSFAIDYDGRAERYARGDVLFIPAGAENRHKAILGAGEKVTLLLFELLEEP
jgi:quercetin dioxygenase-like cupin family protein